MGRKTELVKGMQKQVANEGAGIRHTYYRQPLASISICMLTLFSFFGHVTNNYYFNHQH